MTSVNDDKKNESSTFSAKVKKRRHKTTFRKAPQAPKRFKSSYILFFCAKRGGIKNELGSSASVADVSKRSSELWKALDVNERAKWDKISNEDKQRYMIEKEKYTGPWQVPCKRLKKDPSAPKRPMSAFLFFSQDKRSKIKDANPGMRNTDVSRVLGNMWKDASSEERLQHIEREAEERKKYKVAISRWKVENDLLIKQEEEEPENATDIHSRNIYHQEMVAKDDIRMQHSRLRYRNSHYYHSSTPLAQSHEYNYHRHDQNEDQSERLHQSERFHQTEPRYNDQPIRNNIPETYQQYSYDYNHMHNTPSEYQVSYDNTLSNYPEPTPIQLYQEQRQEYYDPHRNRNRFTS